jgi:DNA-binding LacI/PurR family transcriptional regulator
MKGFFVTTIYDIAKAAGVTATTVSYVLSGKGAVSQATRERVMKYVHELGYRPNLIARSLTKQSTSTIGLVVPSIGNPFYAGLAEVVERLSYESGFRVFITNTYRDDRLGQNLLDDLLSRRVDGIIAVSEGLSLDVLRSLQARSSVPLPLVFCLLEEDSQGFAPAVTFDFFTAGRLAGEHLLGRGHQRIAIVLDGRVSGDIPIEKIHHPLRLAGFQEALALSGYPLDPSLIALGDSSLESGKKAARRLLQLSVPPTAIFATNDLMALGVISTAWELGIQVPHQLSVVGFDDISLAAHHIPPLTTVVMRESVVAEQALKLLFRMIEGEQVSSPPMLRPTFVVRGSTATPYSESSRAFSPERR